MIQFQANDRPSGDTKQKAGELWRLYLNGRGAEDRNRLVEFYTPLVRTQARAMASRMPSGAILDGDDLMTAGIFGLMEAIEHFDPERGKRFESFCTWRVRGAMLDEMRASDWMPRIARLRRRQTQQVHDRFVAENGHPPSQDELAALLDRCDDELNKCLQANDAGRIQSLDEAVSVNGERLLCRRDMVSGDLGEDGTDHVLGRELSGRFIESLARTERLIIKLYYREHLTLKQIGVVLELTESRVSQIHTSVLAKLRRGLEAKVA